ncbi:MAG: Uma2 family endonuclease [Pirellulaceae bacterium]|nr:Uma2 family endonuclease [Pirellulaceae bacterium]
MIHDQELERRLHAQRRQAGSDRYDEVWEAVCITAPMPNTEHQEIVSRLCFVLQETLGWAGPGIVLPGVNLSDRQGDDWHQNYRVPDIALRLADGHAVDCGTHWSGAVDLLVEVVSRGDLSRDKLPFYSRLGVRELLVVDRDPWQLELYHPARQGASLVSRVAAGDAPMASELLPLAFGFLAAEPRPKILVLHLQDGRNWQI